MSLLFLMIIGSEIDTPLLCDQLHSASQRIQNMRTGIFAYIFAGQDPRTIMQIQTRYQESAQKTPPLNMMASLEEIIIKVATAVCQIRAIIQRIRQYIPSQDLATAKAAAFIQAITQQDNAEQKQRYSMLGERISTFERNSLGTVIPGTAYGISTIVRGAIAAQTSPPSQPSEADKRNAVNLQELDRLMKEMADKNLPSSKLEEHRPPSLVIPQSPKNPKRSRSAPMRRLEEHNDVHTHAEVETCLEGLEELNKQIRFKEDRIRASGKSSGKLKEWQIELKVLIGTRDALKRAMEGKPAKSQGFASRIISALSPH